MLYVKEFTQIMVQDKGTAGSRRCVSTSEQRQYDRELQEAIST